MKQLVLSVCWCLISTLVVAQSGLPLKSKILLNSGCSAYVMDAEDGTILHTTPQISMVPASVMKVMTTAAALEILGPEFRFNTRLGYTGKINPDSGVLEGDLVLIGGCDPAFYSEYFSDHYRGTFEAWAASISEAGIKSVRGDLVVDLSGTEKVSVPGGWQWDDLGNYYGAGVSALTYCDNYYNIHFSSPEEPGRPVTISRKEPEIEHLALVNKVTSSEINRDFAVVYGAPGSLSQSVEGTIPKGQADFVVKAAMPDPPRVAATEFLKILKLKNIEFEGSVLEVNRNIINPFNLIAEKTSPTLRELIVPLNQESLNLFAEHLLLEIGRARKNSASLDKSIDAIKEFWQEKGIFLAGFYPADGSGLSRSNGICPRTLAEVLRYMYLSPNRDDFFNSLPVAGLSGTLKYAFKGSKLENNLHAKTGSMTRVKSMAGIFTNHEGKKVVYALIINNFDGTQASVTHLIEDFLMKIYASKPASLHP